MPVPNYVHVPPPPSAMSYLSFPLYGQTIALPKHAVPALLRLLQTTLRKPADAVGIIESFVRSLQAGDAQAPSSPPPSLASSASLSPTSSPASSPATSPATSSLPVPELTLNVSQPHTESAPSLRERAKGMRERMNRTLDASRQAMAHGDAHLTRELLAGATLMRDEMMRLDAAACQMLFQANNKHRQPGQVDLHGLKVKEAIHYVDQCLMEARQRGDTEIQFIVGRGLHSADGTSKLKPAIEGILKKQNLVTALHPGNAGMLVVQLKDQELKPAMRARSTIGTTTDPTGYIPPMCSP